MNRDEELPQAYFGPVGKDETDWRSEPEDEGEDDDEELGETPSDIVEMLGFDPLGGEDAESKEESTPDRN